MPPGSDPSSVPVFTPIRFTLLGGGDPFLDMPRSDFADGVEPAASADDPQGTKIARAAARAAGLTTPEERAIFHRAISGQGLMTFKELYEIARQIKEQGGY